MSFDYQQKKIGRKRSSNAPRGTAQVSLISAQLTSEHLASQSIVADNNHQQHLQFQQHDSYCDLISMNPAQQKSAHNSSGGLASQIEDDSSGSNTVRMVNESVEVLDEEGKLAGNGDVDDTQPLDFSPQLSPLDQKLRHDLSEKNQSKHFLAGTSFADHQEYHKNSSIQHVGAFNEKTGSDISFDDQNDSVGQEYSMQISQEKLMPNNSQTVEGLKYLSSGGDNMNRDTEENAATVALDASQKSQVNKYLSSVGNRNRYEKTHHKEQQVNSSPTQIQDYRQKMRVRGSVVRSNFQQSLQNMNGPMRNSQSRIPIMEAASKKRPPLGKMSNDKTVPSLLLKNLIENGSDYNIKQEQQQQLSQRSIGASQSMKNMYYNRKPSRSSVQKDRVPLKTGEERAMGPKIFADKPYQSTNSSKLLEIQPQFSSAKNPGAATRHKGLLNDVCSSSVSLSTRKNAIRINEVKFASYAEKEFESSLKLLQIGSKNVDDGRMTVANFTVGESHNSMRPHINEQPKQPNISDVGDLSNSEDEASFDGPINLSYTINKQNYDENGEIDDDINPIDDKSPHRKLSEDDLGVAFPNIGPRQLQKLQSIKTLTSSNQLILKGSRFEEKRQLEARKVFLESKSQDGITEHTFNQLQMLQNENNLMQTTKNSNPKATVLKNRRKYQIDQNPQLTELKMPRINLKFVSLNLFSKNLLNIDLSENKIKSLPEEIATISTLQVLKIDQNLITSLPKDLWKLSKLTKLVASNNQIEELPPNFEWLYNLECLQINDNFITRLPEKFGLLTNITKLYLHENRLATLPRDLSKLNNLIDFSLEWFMYTKPANSRIQKNPNVIKSVRDFCQNFHFNPSQSQSRIAMLGNGIINTSNGIAQRALQMSMCSELSFKRKDSNHSGNGKSSSKYVTFSDFVIQYHKIPHSDMSLVNKIEYTMKKRSLVHQLCFNIHIHLLNSLLNIQNEDASENSINLEGKNDSLRQDSKQKNKGMIRSSQNIQINNYNNDLQDQAQENSEAAIAKVINLNKKDTQGVVPLCLLVMNMTPIDRTQNQTKDAKQKIEKEFAKSTANFFSQDSNYHKSKYLNKRRKQMMRILLSCKDEQGEPLVDINNYLRNKAGQQRSQVMMPQEQRIVQLTGNQQHPILYWAVFKYQFKLAIELTENYRADPTVLNNNNSNLLHILFANFSHDLKYAGKLAELLINRKVNLNLVDKDGKSPILVAIKKNQIESIKFAHQHNIKKYQSMLSNPSFMRASSLIKKNLCKIELFDFQMKGRVQVTPLHYVVKKSNYEAFLYLVQNKMCDYLQRNQEQLTPRLSALINSAFYRVLLKEERSQVRSQIASLEFEILSKQQETQQLSNKNKIATPKQSLLGFVLTQKAVLCNEIQFTNHPPKFMQKNEQNPLALMHKMASESSTANYETLHGIHNSRPNFQLEQSLFSSAGLNAEIQPNIILAQTGTNQQTRNVDFLTIQNSIDEYNTIGSSRMAIPIGHAAIQKQKNKLSYNKVSQKFNSYETSERKSTVRKTFQNQNQKNPDYIQKQKQDKQIEKIIDLEQKRVLESRHQVEQEMQFNQLNYVCQYVYSLRSISICNDDIQVEIVENIENESMSASNQHNYKDSDRDQVKRPNRSSTLRLSDANNFEFTLGQVASKLKLLNNQNSETKPKTSKGVARQANDVFETIKLRKISDQLSSQKVSPISSDYGRRNKNQNENTNNSYFSNREEDLTTTRVLNYEQRTSQQKLKTTNQSMSNTNFKQFSMFRGIKNRQNFSPDGREVKTGMMRQYEQRANEMMKPLGLKRPTMESPDQYLRRQISDVSIPPSYRQNDETQKQISFDNSKDHKQKSSRVIRDLKQKLKQCSDLDFAHKEEQDGDFMMAGDHLIRETDGIQLDEVLQESNPKRATSSESKLNAEHFNDADEVVNVMSQNLFDRVKQDEQFQTVRAQEGPLRQRSPKLNLEEIVQSERLNMKSPHFNEESQYVQQEQRQGDGTRLEGTQKYNMPNRAHSPSTMGYVMSSASNRQRQNINQPVATQAENQQQVQAVNQKKNNIFISNMNININLNININYPNEKVSNSSNSKNNNSLPETDNDLKKPSHSNSNSQEHQLSTILDEEQFNEDQHRPKPSIGSKPPAGQDFISVESEAMAADNIKTTTWGSMIESQAKQITEQQILNQLNPSEIVQAVSMQLLRQQRDGQSLQQDYQQHEQPLFSSCDLRGQTYDDLHNTATDVNNQRAANELQMRMSHAGANLPSFHIQQSPIDNLKMFKNNNLTTASQKDETIEQKKFSPEKVFMVNQNTMMMNNSKSGQKYPESNSEDIATSVIGNTPSKPSFGQSALKEKQLIRQQIHNQNLQRITQDYQQADGGQESIQYNQQRYSPISRGIQDRIYSPQFSHPKNGSEFFSGRINGQSIQNKNKDELDFNMMNQPLITQIRESPDKIVGNSQQYVLGYLMTDNAQKRHLQKQGDQPLQSMTMLSAASRDGGFLKSQASRLNQNGGQALNTYTLANLQIDDQQVTLPSMTQQSHIALQTGVSDIGCQSPIDPPNLIINNSFVPKISLPNHSNKRFSMDKVIENSNEQQAHKKEVLEIQIKNKDLMARCERQLSQNYYLNEFKTICDKTVPDWIKYSLIYEKLATKISLNGNQKCIDDSLKRDDALLCLQLLIEVLTEEPCAVLQDLVHLFSKSNVMCARNERLESICNQLTFKTQEVVTNRKPISKVEQTIVIHKRSIFKSQTTILDSFCFSPALYEANNAQIVSEIYKRIQLNKFPTISKNLGLFLRNKRQTEKSNVEIISREEIQKTQNIPQSLQKRVKISMKEKPQMIDQPLNENIFTPRDTINLYRPQTMQPNPDQSVPQSHPTKLASQMAHLNQVSMANKPGFHAKLQTRLAESVISNNTSKRSSFVARPDSHFGSSVDLAGINVSKEYPSHIQPIRNILSPKGFFPNK